MTDILPATPEAIAQAVKMIRTGAPIAVPTETVYGLAADATNSQAVAAIYTAKGRPSFNPLIVHVPDLAAAEGLAQFNEDARTLAAAFWPGPLTLVLPRREDSPIASLATAGLPTIALRVPAHLVMRALLDACGHPLAAPSANASGRVSATTAQHVAASLGGRISLILDGGACPVGIESTIIALTSDTPRILRPGAITAEMLSMCLGRPIVAGSASAAIEAPGQLPSHYAPSKPVRLDATSAQPDEYWIGFCPVDGDETLSASGDLTEAAAHLFDALHRADASAQARIAVAPIPQTGLGVAINDRLARAAA